MPSQSKFAAYVALTRMDRPVGTFLLLWPTLGALWAAADTQPPALLIVIFALGTWFMRSAGCVMNDIADRNIDGGVSRTNNRPLVRGDLSLNEAIGALVVMTALAATSLIFLNNLTRLLALVGLALAMTYPFFKRWTYLPQVPLGAAFSWGIVMAYAAVQNTVPPAAWVLFLGSLLWIVAYDTLYAMVDREDDLRIGVKSTAILFGGADRLIIGALQACALFVFYLYGQQSEFQVFYFLALFAIAGLFIFQQRIIVDREPAACFDAFRNNQWVGLVLFLGILFEVHFAPLLVD